MLEPLHVVRKVLHQSDQNGNKFRKFNKFLPVINLGK